MDHGSTRLAARDGPHRQQASGVCRRGKGFFGWFRGGSHSKTKRSSKEERQRERCKSISRGGDRVGDPSDASGRPETNFLEQTIDYDTWAICLPRWIASSRTKFWWFLQRTFSMGWDRPVSATATFPLPLPHPGVWRGGGPGLNRRKLHQLAQRRLLHVVVMALNYHFCGGLRRLPNAWQLSVFERLRSSLFACGTTL